MFCLNCPKDKAQGKIFQWKPWYFLRGGIFENSTFARSERGM